MHGRIKKTIFIVIKVLLYTIEFLHQYDFKNA